MKLYGKLYFKKIIEQKFSTKKNEQQKTKANQSKEKNATEGNLSLH